MNYGQIKVSICCITYNHSDYIEQALNGFLNQITDFEFEICIGEDESVDGTREICEDFASKHPDKIRLFLRDRSEDKFIKKGLPGRKNFIETLQSCRGKYVAICDGDDYWTDPKKLQKQVDFLENNEDYFMCFTNSMIVDKNDNIIQSQFFLNSKHSFNANDLFQKKNPISTLTTMFKSEYLTDDVLKNIKGSIWGDWTTWSSLAVQSKKKIGYLNEVCAAYRITKDGAYSGISSQIIRERNIAHHKINLISFGDEYAMEIKNTISILTFEKFNHVQKQSKFRGLVYLFFNLRWIIYQNSIRDVIYVLRSK